MQEEKYTKTYETEGTARLNAQLEIDGLLGPYRTFDIKVHGCFMAPGDDECHRCFE